MSLIAPHLLAGTHTFLLGPTPTCASCRGMRHGSVQVPEQGGPETQGGAGPGKFSEPHASVVGPMQPHGSTLRSAPGPMPTHSLCEDRGQCKTPCGGMKYWESPRSQTTPYLLVRARTNLCHHVKYKSATDLAQVPALRHGAEQVLTWRYSPLTETHPWRSHGRSP